MSREITTHRLNGLNDAISIYAVDDRGAGNANHVYELGIGGIAAYSKISEIRFQKGPIQEAGPNGLSNEALIAVVIDRLQGFQSGDFACRENALALTKLEEAMHWLQHRTRERLARGVEGTTQK